MPKNSGKTTKREKMAKPSVSHDEKVIAKLRGQEKLQAEFIKTSLEDNSDEPKAILSALRLVAEARGFSSFAEETQLNRQSLYRALDENGNPTLDSLLRMLDVLGLRLTVAHKSNAG